MPETPAARDGRADGGTVGTGDERAHPRWSGIPAQGGGWPGEYDLAGRRPGALVRRRADEELAAQRARSRFGSVLARLFDLKTDERAWRIGAQGEEVVGSRLEQLAEWRVLHSVPVGQGASDIDHVLIGPGGVWTINTKNRPGARVSVTARGVYVQGHHTPYLRNARYEADRARGLLAARLGWTPPVLGCLVMLTGSLAPLKVRSQPADVVVLGQADLHAYFRGTPHRLPRATVEEIFAVARRSTTWTTPLTPAARAPRRPRRPAQRGGVPGTR